jgi:CRP-like cAMP-binding protein
MNKIFKEELSSTLMASRISIPRLFSHPYRYIVLILYIDFRRDVQVKVRLSPVLETILLKPSWERTEQDLEELTWLMSRLKCFSQYTPYTLRELSRILGYEAFEKGRVVIRQGDPGLSFYFVVSGTVNVEVNEHEVDARTGKRRSHIVGELHAGASFGELALLHNTSRKATIVCKTSCQFLRVDKEDFNMVLRKKYQQEIDNRLAHLRKQPKFHGWSEADLAMAAETSKLVEYPADSVILQDMETQLDDVYFITKGECYIAKTFDLLYQLRRDNSMRIMMPPSLIGRRAVTVIDESDALSLAQSKTTWTHHGASILDYMSAEEISYLVAGRRKRYQPIRAVKALVQLRVLGSGDFFGVGEYLTESRVITTKKVHI